MPIRIQIQRSLNCLQIPVKADVELLSKIVEKKRRHTACIKKQSGDEQ
jgi:hypothetical protein